MVGPEHRREAELSVRADGRPAGHPVLAEIVRRLVDELHPQRVYLFGSRARGEATEESDYDVLVLVQRPQEELLELTRQAYRALRGVDASVDVVVMDEGFFDRRRVVIASLPGTVEREGQILYAA